MNIMAQAHSDTRDYMAQQARIVHAAFVPLTYRQVFKAMLVNCHAHYKLKVKAMTNTVKVKAIKETCISDTAATDFVIEGTAVDSEGELVHIGFATGNEGSAQKEAEYYMNLDNGFTNVQIMLVMHYHGKSVKEFKIVK